MDLRVPDPPQLRQRPRWDLANSPNTLRSRPLAVGGHDERPTQVPSPEQRVRFWWSRRARPGEPHVPVRRPLYGKSRAGCPRAARCTLSGVTSTSTASAVARDQLGHRDDTGSGVKRQITRRRWGRPRKKVESAASSMLSPAFQQRNGTVRRPPASARTPRCATDRAGLRAADGPAECDVVHRIVEHLGIALPEAKHHGERIARRDRGDLAQRGAERGVDERVGIRVVRECHVRRRHRLAVLPSGPAGRGETRASSGRPTPTARPACGWKSSSRSCFPKAEVRELQEHLVRQVARDRELAHGREQDIRPRPRRRYHRPTVLSGAADRALAPGDEEEAGERREGQAGFVRGAIGMAPKISPRYLAAPGPGGI